MKILNGVDFIKFSLRKYLNEMVSAQDIAKYSGGDSSKVSEIFNSNPELANIGTLEQYSQYLDTIFPSSKVKDIVYHGSSISNIDKLKVPAYFSDNSYSKESGLRKWYYNLLNTISEDESYSLFGDSSEGDNRFQKLEGALLYTTPKTYAYNNSKYKQLRDKLINKGYIKKDITLDNFITSYPAVLNIKNPNKVEEVHSDILQNQKKNFDSVIGKDKNEDSDVYVVFEPEQINILGNEQDVEGFKKYVTNTSSKIKG